MRKPRLEPKIDDQKEKARIHTVLNRLEGIKNKKQFLNDTIKIYDNQSNRLLPRKVCDHYTNLAKYCEMLLKSIS